MTVGKRFSWLASVTLLVVVGCQTAPSAKPGIWQDVDFVRGCWISRSGDNAVSMLRLLPSRSGSATLEGYLQYLDGAKITSSSFLTLARNGSHIDIAGPSYPSGTFGRVLHPYWFKPRHSNSASFEDNGGPEGNSRVISVDGDEENLRVSYSDGPSGDALIHIVLFEGRRDGCD